MARPCRQRRICSAPAYDRFYPDGVTGGETVTLTLDEYETIRLMDTEKLTHEQCAALMDISRTTVTEIYESARGKIADAIVNGKALTISGGRYKFCNGSAASCCRKHCTKSALTMQTPPLPMKGDNTMRIAVTYENGNIFQHFGHTEQFKIYDAEDGKIVAEHIADTNGNGHGALAGFLSSMGVDVLICGGIGGGAQNALASAGIKLYGGASGNADEAVKALLGGKLDYDPNVHCSHHDHEGGNHSCTDHKCGEHKCH